MTAQAGILIEAGGPELITAQDRWERTPLDEAQRVEAQPLVKLLERALQGESSETQQASSQSGHKWW